MKQQFNQKLFCQQQLGKRRKATVLPGSLDASNLGNSRLRRLKRLSEMAPAYACVELFETVICDLRERTFEVEFVRVQEGAANRGLFPVENPMDLESYPDRELIDLCFAIGILTLGSWKDLRKCLDIIQEIRYRNDPWEVSEEECTFLTETCLAWLSSEEKASPDIVEIRPPDRAGEQKADMLESILDAMPEFIVYYDQRLNVTWANRAAAEHIRLTREKMVGKNFFKVACRQEEPCEGCPIITGISSEYAEAIESNLYIGRLFFSRSLPVSRQGGRLPNRVMVAQDITGLNNRFGVTDILNAISETFHSPKNLSEMCKEVVSTIASRFEFPAGYITLFDEERREIVNLGEVDFSGKFFPMAERLPASRCFSGKVMQDGGTINLSGLSKMAAYDGYVLKEAGAETVLAVPIEIEGNTMGAVILIDYVERLESNLMVKGLQAVANRVGAEINRRQMEEKLKAERKFTNAVLNNAGPLIIVLDQEGFIVSFNKACEKLTGYTYQQAVGRPAWEFLADPNEINFIKNMFPLDWKKASGSAFENCWSDADGRGRLVSWSNSIMGDSEEKRLHVVCIGIDITERRRAEKEAEIRRRQILEADKMASLGMMASGAAHEINNPNSFIMMNAPILRQAWQDLSPLLDRYYDKYGDFLLANIPFSEMRMEIPELFNGIEDGSKRIRQIILNMKDYARKNTLDMNQMVDLREVVRAALGLLAHQIKESTDALSIDSPADLPTVRGNRQRLEQVIVNLIQNACQSLISREKGIVVRIFSDPDKNEIVLCVEDEGTGIRPEHLDCIFDPFFTTKSETGGTGLGLSVCQSIVKEHGGTLRFASELGKGTRACLTLPRA